MIVGDILESPGRPTLQLLAVDNGAWICTELNKFGPPRRLSDEETIAYGAAPPPARPSDAEGWQRLGKAYEGRD